MNTLFVGVIGQPEAMMRLENLSKNPPHAYLFVGPSGTGKMAAALGFAAMLLCENGGCGECRTCRLARTAQHPDLTIMTHEGATVLKGEAQAIRTAAYRSPVEGRRKVLVLDDFHEASPESVALLLKAVEEPPASTFFVLLSNDVPPELVTIASRCVRIEFRVLSSQVIAEFLIKEGWPELDATHAAHGADGNLRRAQLLVTDDGFVGRQKFWATLPDRFDGTGATVDALVNEIVGLVESAGAPLAVQQSIELAELEERVKTTGERGSGRADLVKKHARELRRLRRDELRFGLGELSRAYRDRLTGSHPDRVVEAIARINDMASHLVRNPNENLQLQALFIALGS